jgi:phosphinothricin acetyltransferase
VIRTVKNSDIPFICDIYNYYIKNSTATFEEDPVDETEVDKKVKEVTKNYPWIVFEENDIVTGYSYAYKWKNRAAYKNSAESAVYVHKDYFGKGMGNKLLEKLIEEVKSRNIHCLIGGIALPNEPSIALHEKFGFKKCAMFKEVGFKFGRWIDVGYWEKIF